MKKVFPGFKELSGGSYLSSNMFLLFFSLVTSFRLCKRYSSQTTSTLLADYSCLTPKAKIDVNIFQD